MSAILAPSGECCGTSSRRAYSVCARSSARRWISDHRTAASAAASPPGASATLIASCRAEPFAYASTSLDCQPAAAAERRREERAIKAIRPARTRTPSRTQSQIRLVPEEAAGAAEAAAGGWVVGAAVTLGLAGAVAVRLGKLPIELLMVLPHPAASNPAASRVAGRESLFAERRMVILPRRVWPAAGASVAAGSLSRVPGRLRSPGLVIRRLPGWADSASDTIVTVRRRVWGQIWRFRCVPAGTSATSTAGEPGTGGAAGFGNTGISAGYAAFRQTFQPGDPP